MRRITFYLLMLSSIFLTAQNNSLSFDKIDDTVDLGQNFGFNGGDTFTVEAWIYLENNSDIQQIISKLGFGSTSFRGWGFQILTGNRLSAYITSAWQTDRILIRGTRSLQNNVWYHVAMTYDGEQSVLMYIDGEIEPESNSDYFGTITTFDTDAPTRIGSYEGNGFPGEFFKGNIDELRIWNTVRSQEEIAANYSTELSGAETGLIGYYKMDTVNSSCDVQDCSLNQFHGTRLGDEAPNDLPQFSENIPDINDVACGTENECELGIGTNQEIMFSVFPNPANDEITFSGLVTNNAHVVIYNVLGKVIKQKVLQDNKINISDLSSGIYLVAIKEKGNTATVKLIKK